MLRFTSGLLLMTLVLAVGVVTVVDLVLLPRLAADECVQYDSEADRVRDQDGRVLHPDSASCAVFPCTAERRSVDRFLYPDQTTREVTDASCDEPASTG